MRRLSCEFFGISIYMYWGDHGPPHFHARYSGHKASITIEELSLLAGASHRVRLNGLVNGRRSVTPDTALRLAKVFGTTPGFWMNHQLR